MKKKKSGGGGANWMDTYGDMVTLLLCFFVLLYSMSSISEESWKALVMSFNPKAMQDVSQTPGGTGPSADEDKGAGVFDVPDDTDNGPNQEDIDKQMDDLFEALEQMINNSGLNESVEIKMVDDTIYLSFRDNLFFAADAYYLRTEAVDILTELCAVLDTASDAIEEIQVEGHTAQGSPNTPNDPEFDRFLASNRATEVVLFIQTHSSIHPARIASVGRGQWHPISSNKTAETRQYNRRVELAIRSRNLELEELGESISNFILQYETDMGQSQ